MRRTTTVRMSPGRRRRVTAGVGCLLSAVVLAVLPLPRGVDQARAATTESSAVTRTGTKAANGDDFSQLKVTVHQTEDLTGQGVRVTWTGGDPSDRAETNYLSVMQCWGDEASGPDRTQCEYGSASGSQASNKRSVYPAGVGYVGDSLETESGTPVDKNGTHYVPFRPVEGQGDPTTSSTDTTYFSENDTNAVPYLPNDGNGGGDTAFEVKSSVEQPALGCGARETSAGEVQPCWLVVVPHGTHNLDGTTHVASTDTASSLSQSNWDQRIVFRLGFRPVAGNCDPDKPERGIMGSELATDAITSWQSALCRTGTYRFNFTQSGEGQARDAVTSGDSEAGLALTVDPVEPVDGQAQVVHAPIAVSGLTIGFVWMYTHTTGDGSDLHLEQLPLTELKLNQRLLAKVLTQSYPFSVTQPSDGVPDYLSGNPESIVKDPEFLRLNPGLDGQAAVKAPLGLAVTSDNTDSARLVWKYILANSDAREFIEGKKDPWGMKVNPAYEDGVISDSLDFFPKTDLTPTQVGCLSGNVTRTAQDVVPYVNDMHDGALKVRRGSIGTAYTCASGDPLPRLSAEPRPIPTDQRQYGIVDNASAVRYQLGAAALPNADGDYVTPTNASLLKAVAEMPDSDVAGVKASDPAKMKDGAYPLTAVVYAASSLDQAEDARQDYAKVMRYAAGAGQTQGTENGELPYGYAPLPQAMRTQAEQAADRLEKGVPDAGESSDGTSGGDDLSGTGSGGAAGGSAAGGTGTGGDSAGTSGAATGGGASDTARPSAAPSETDPAQQNVAQSGGSTPAEVLGLIRWVLLGVLVAGGAAALAGPVMLRLSVRRAASTNIPGGELE
ncbi:hypothetical protein ACGF3G_47285 [Streptomyces sp. NPDC048179]|uniref:hypothetical protein n=1 Tax=Streptomyces sp. NPDC048179 TaxID=3365506 RepID=UPI0037104F80